MHRIFQSLFLITMIFLAETVPVTAQVKSDQKLSQSILYTLQTIESREITRETASARDISSLSTALVHIDTLGRVHIYVHLSVLGERELTELMDREVEIEIANSQFLIVQGWAPFDRLEEIAALSFVRQVQPPDYGSSRTGAFNTEGDSILLADQLRQLGLDGSGVKIGVISDGANDRSDAQATGDLPENITVFGTCTKRPFDGSVCDRGSTCNEGTAMLEIIHDIAPGAELAIAAVSTSLEFVSRLDDLVNNFGAQVVVDDLGFYFQPFFADGLIAASVVAVTGQVLYISSAGNSAQHHHEANYSPTTLQGFEVHDFGQMNGGSSDGTMNVRIEPGSFLLTVLQWNDPFSGSANDYDMYLLNQAEIDVLCPGCSSTQFQAGIQDPIEAICYFNDTDTPVQGKLVVEKYSGSSRRLEIYMSTRGVTVEEHITPEGSIFGHPGLPAVVAVGAIGANDPGHDDIQPYSSRGPARIDFPGLEIRDKPDLAAIDGVAVTGTGGFPAVFFGTSAAAPHVAGVAALLKQARPDAPPGTIREALSTGAVDLGQLGRDMIFGSGRLNARDALYAIAPDTDGDGVPDLFDAFPDDPAESADTDLDGTGNNADTDDDNDGIPDPLDALPLDPSRYRDTRILVSRNGVVHVYSGEGIPIRSIQIPTPAEDPYGTEYPRDLAIDASGRLVVYNGTFDPYLSVFNSQTGAWAHRTHAGWSTANNGSYGGIGMFARYAFVTDMRTFGDGGADEAMGLIRFDLDAGTSTRFASTIEPIDLNLGQDGLLYALYPGGSPGGTSIDIYDPDTLSYIRTIDLSSTLGWKGNRAIAANASGQLFVADWDGRLLKLDAEGNLLAENNLCSIADDCNALDIDVSATGKIIISYRFGSVVLTDEEFTAPILFDSGNDGGFVTFQLIGISSTSDYDNDGIPDEYELANGLDPLDSLDASLDSDTDGLINSEEFRLGSSVNNSDTDSDGLNDGEEFLRGTDIHGPDTDSDGMDDGAEVNTGRNPLINEAAVLLLLNSLGE
ncbi:MAG: hypothetical protein A3J35_06295 [Gammaproteobacteria bacterium RIFCSPLOWO2_02_FULL_52_10]|nr:MAG: hypothetical protein A3J35_06295 [Gammaproteobacteria bacterium RIFCSPLOWO2_02_FULL_52_10]